MKKALLIILTSWALTDIYGQNSGFFMGISGGISHTYMYGNTIFKEQHSPTVGFSGGVLANYCFNNNFSVLTFLSYEKKGSFYFTTIPNGDDTNPGYYKIHFNYNYLMFPLLFRYSFGKKVTYFINAGPMAGYLLFQQTKTKSNIMQVDDQYLTTSFKHWDFGISSGIGALFPIAPHLYLSTEIRNNIGLKSLNRYTIANNGMVKTLATTLLVGLSFKL